MSYLSLSPLTLLSASVRGFLCLGALASAHAAPTLTWGSGGTGGSGTWNTTTANWWNGSQNVPWTAGGTAVFAGTAGTVEGIFPGPSPSGIVFDTPGYLIQSGWIESPNDLTVTTNQSATISSTLSSSAIGGTLVKKGAASLTIAGTNFFDNVRIDEGEYRTGGTSSLFFSDVTLANAPGVALTLGQTSASITIGSLSGGGTAGGVVRPSAEARTVTLSLSGAGSFGGVLSDNGSGKLAWRYLGGSSFTIIGSGETEIVTGSRTGLKTETLTNANTYSGATAIEVGILSFSGNGSALNSAVTVSGLGTLLLDNATVANANRLSDSATLTLQGGGIQLTGNAVTAVEEVLGNLNFSGASSLTVTPLEGAAAALTFSGATRTAHGTLEIAGGGQVRLGGVANNATGIVNPFITAGDDWAVADGDGRISPFDGYAGFADSHASTDHLKLTGGGTSAFAADATRASLNIRNDTASTSALDLGGAVFTLTSGGILTSGSGAAQIQNGTLQTSSGELIVTARNNLTIASAIGESVSGTVLTKSGSGVLTLTGSNTYSGLTAINEGTLVVSSDANLGTGTSVEFSGGALKAAGSFVSAKGFSRGTSLAGTVDTNGFDLRFDGPNTTAISKTGEGTLTLANSIVGTAFLNQGTLALPMAGSGSVWMRGGTLMASGTLSRLIILNHSTLDIGGASAASLTIRSFDLHGSLIGRSPLTIHFGIGSTESDLLTLGGDFPLLPLRPFMPPSVLFNFEDLGGLATGVDYPLINLLSSIGPFLSPSLFGLAPELVAEGWHGTFTTSGDSVSVKFSTIPEPGTWAFVLAAGALGLLRRRRPRASS